MVVRIISYNMATKNKSKTKDKKDNVDKKQIKLLKSVIEDLINKQSVTIIDLLAGKKNVNEFSIAEKLKLTINQTRNILYKLSDYGLVSFIRKKDKRKGWYIYFWTLDTYQSLSLLEEKLKKKLGVLEAQFRNRKDGRHYVCNTCSIEVNEETALLNEFTCPECEEVYELSDDAEIIEKIDKNILKLKREIEKVSAERIRQEEKIDKEKQKKIKKAEKEKEKKRREKRLANKILKEKLNKKAAKKKPAKEATKKAAKKSIKKTKKSKPVKKSTKKTSKTKKSKK